MTRLKGSAVVCTGDSVGAKVASTWGALVGATVAMGALVMGAKLGAAVGGGGTVGSRVAKMGDEVGSAVTGVNVGELVLRIVGDAVATATGRSVGADCGLLVAKKGGGVGPASHCVDIVKAKCESRILSIVCHGAAVNSSTHIRSPRNAHSQSSLSHTRTLQRTTPPTKQFKFKVLALAEIESTYCFYPSFLSWPSSVCASYLVSSLIELVQWENAPTRVATAKV
jgi:hypothetical protein